MGAFDDLDITKEMHKRSSAEEQKRTAVAQKESEWETLTNHTLPLIVSDFVQKACEAQAKGVIIDYKITRLTPEVGFLGRTRIRRKKVRCWAASVQGAGGDDYSAHTSFTITHFIDADGNFLDHAGDVVQMADYFRKYKQTFLKGNCVDIGDLLKNRLRGGLLGEYKHPVKSGPVYRNYF